MTPPEGSANRMREGGGLGHAGLWASSSALIPSSTCPPSHLHMIDFAEWISQSIGYWVESCPLLLPAHVLCDVRQVT